jgi:hypothetical protein
VGEIQPASVHSGTLTRGCWPVVPASRPAAKVGGNACAVSQRADELGVWVCPVEHQGEAGFDGAGELVAVEVEGEPTEPADAGGGFVVAAAAGDGDGEGPGPFQEGVAGLDAGAVVGAVDLHGEAVAAGVDPPGDGRLEGGGPGLEAGGLGQGVGGGAGEAVAVVAVGDGEALQLGEFGLDAGLFDDQGAAGGKGFDFGVGQHGSPTSSRSRPLVWPRMTWWMNPALRSQVCHMYTSKLASVA